MKKLEHTRDYYKGRMPRSDNKALYILEELGHRLRGRVYRTMSKNGNLCVLKYFVHSQFVVVDNKGTRREVNTEDAVNKSVEYWNKAYASWLPTATCGK
jgi:hypothetical protein